MDKRTDVANRKFTTWAFHQAPSVAWLAWYLPRPSSNVSLPSSSASITKPPPLVVQILHSHKWIRSFTLLADLDKTLNKGKMRRTSYWHCQACSPYFFLMSLKRRRRDAWGPHEFVKAKESPASTLPCIIISANPKAPYFSMSSLLQP